MARYPVRPWWHPLGMMAQNPAGYPWFIVSAFILLVFPWRYKISRYYERQRDSAGQCLRLKAIRMYHEIECMYRRETMWKHPMWMTDDSPLNRNHAIGMASNVALGHGEGEQSYWNAHQKDMVRAARLIEEIEELRAKGVTMEPQEPVSIRAAH